MLIEELLVEIISEDGQISMARYYMLQRILTELITLGDSHLKQIVHISLPDEVPYVEPMNDREQSLVNILNNLLELTDAIVLEDEIVNNQREQDLILILEMANELSLSGLNALRRGVENLSV